MEIFKIYSKKNVLKLLLFFILTTVSSFTSYIIFKKLELLFTMISGERERFSLNLVFIIIAAYVVFFLVTTVYSYFNLNLIEEGTKNLRRFILRKIFRTNELKILNENTSMLVSNINMSCSNVAGYYTAIIGVATQAIELIVYGLLIFQLNKATLILCLGVFPITILATIGFKNKITLYNQKFMENSKNLAKMSTESFENIKLVKAKNEEEYFEDRIIQEHNELIKNIGKCSFFGQCSGSISSFIISLAPLIIITINVYLFKWNNINNSDLLLLFIFIPLFFSKFVLIYGLVNTYFAKKPYIKTYKELMRIEEENLDGESIDDFIELKTEAVSCSYDDERKITIPDISIKKGDKVMIVGESGIGKSSLFNILIGFIKEYRGNIFVNNIELRNIKIESLRKLIGICFQKNDVFTLSLKENIDLGENINIQEVLRLCRLEKLYGDKNDEELNTNTVSGGEKSRISLAQTIIRENDVLLIDESLSALDKETEEEIMTELLELYKDKTIICISHNKAVQKYFNRIISFDKSEVL